MKRKFRTRISCLLIASLCIGLLSATALAADPPAGTVEDPTVTENVTTDTKQDTPAPGQTTTTTTTEKEWKGTTTEAGTTTTVNGEETTNDTTVTAPDGDLLDQTGTVAGSETTTTTPGAGDPPEGPDTTDVVDSKLDGSVEVTVEPGKNTNDDPKEGTTGNVSAWLKDKAVPDWANDKSQGSERADDGTVTNIVKKDDNTYTKTVTSPDGSVSIETVMLTKDEKGRVTGYTKTTETTTSVTGEMGKPEVPDQATVGKDGDTTYSFELPEKPEITNPVQRDADGKPVSGEEVLPLIDTNGSVIGYTKVTYDNGEASFSDPVLGAYYRGVGHEEFPENRVLVALCPGVPGQGIPVPAAGGFGRAAGTGHGQEQRREGECDEIIFHSVSHLRIQRYFAGTGKQRYEKYTIFGRAEGDFRFRPAGAARRQ